MREWVAGSKCVLQRENELYNQVHKEKIFEHKVQPYYALRCVPQILGPIYDELENAEEVLINEINSACDNPIVRKNEGKGPNRGGENAGNTSVFKGYRNFN